MLREPVKGKTSNGNKAVAEIGMASEIHHTAIQIARAITAKAFDSNPEGSHKKLMAKKDIGPRKKTMRGTFLLIY
ncbi:hypothetical protein ACFFUR_12115 [Echinicola jeungdonensis]|uniref:Uncharacterized protein n=1 Tax=Echinicola jeungdonensis TaxID=709343 RepID=A0ABV5J6W7_9BACT